MPALLAERAGIRARPRCSAGQAREQLTRADGNVKHDQNPESQIEPVIGRAPEE